MSIRLTLVTVLAACAVAQGSIYRVDLPELIGDYTLDYHFDDEGYIHIDDSTSYSSMILLDGVVPLDQQVMSVEYFISGTNDMGERSDRGVFYTGPATFVTFFDGADDPIEHLFRPLFEKGEINYTTSYDNPFAPAAPAAI